MSISHSLRLFFISSIQTNIRFILTLAASILFFVAAGRETHAATLIVSAGGNLQAALNAAQPGDTIELEAGASFVGSFVLPVKSGDAFITVQSSQLASLPAEGVRVTPAHAPLMPKILSPGQGQAALRTSPGAHHFRFIGIEFAPVNAAAFLWQVISLGDVQTQQDTLEEVPHHLIFDRCYIHAHPGQDLRRGIMLNSAHTEILNSYISDFKSRGFDSQAIGGWNGPGPFKIINNYLEGAGENVMFGGSDPSIPNLVPSDIEVRRNHMSKPLAWRGVWTVKNIFELKNARRVVVEGNLMENNWGDAQMGESILFTVRNQDGGGPWSVVEDVQFINNIVRRVAGGVNILGRDYYYPSEQTKRIVVRNNFFDDINGEALNGRGGFVLISDGSSDVTFDHNTVRHTGSVILATGTPHGGFVFTNNLMAHNQYGIYGDGTGAGNHTLNTYFPGVVMRRNVIAGAQTSNYPSDNFYPASLSAAGLVDFLGGDYHLRADSMYRGQATDGKDVGCDFAALEAAMSGTTADPTPTPTPTPTPSATPVPTPTPTATPTPTPTPAPTPTPTPTPAPTNGLSPWRNQDVGNVSRAGSASFSNGTYTISGEGTDVWGDADGFHYVYQPLNGDGEIVAHVSALGNANAKVGLMIRESLSANARHVMMAATSSGLEFLRRTDTAANTAYNGAYGTAPQWLKLTRQGNTFKGYKSSDGVSWQLIGTVTVSMNSSVQIGMLVTSRSASQLSTATINNVGVSGGVEPPPPPATTAGILVSQALANATSLAAATNVTEAEILSLSSSIELAQTAFSAEASSYAAAEQIETHMRIALYFARAAASLAAADAPANAIQARLRISAARLQQVRDMMAQAAGASGALGSQAATPSADIGAAETRSSASFAPVLAPSSMGTITGSSSQSPLASGEVTGKPNANGALPFELAGASVSVGGVAANLIYASPSRIDFTVPAGIPSGEAEVIVTSQDGYVSRGVMTIAAFAPGLFTVGGSGSREAIALNSASYTSGAFDLFTPESLSSDKRTRVMLFATGIRAAANWNTGNDVRRADGSTVANLAESVTVEARTNDGRVFNLPVEFAGAGQFAGLDQLTVRLVQELQGAGQIELTLSIGGQTSNIGTITIQ